MSTLRVSEMLSAIKSSHYYWKSRFVCTIWAEGKLSDINRFNPKESCPKTLKTCNIGKHHAPQHLGIEYLSK